MKIMHVYEIYESLWKLNSYSRNVHQTDPTQLQTLSAPFVDSCGSDWSHGEKRLIDLLAPPQVKKVVRYARSLHIFLMWRSII